MPVLEITAGEILLGDRFSDGTVVCGIREKPDGRVAVAYTRRAWRSRRLRVFDLDEPVSVFRRSVAAPVPVPPVADGRGLWPLSRLLGR